LSNHYGGGDKELFYIKLTRLSVSFFVCFFFVSLLTMTKREIPENEAISESNSTISAVDQKSISPIDSSTNSTEKPEVEQTEIKDDTVNETSEEEIKRKKKEKVGRILTFLGLQIALFLAALDG
jgi:sorbitol-specific phosphotransferase system component IIBC